MPEPTVFTILQPPSPVPMLSAHAATSFTQTGTAKEPRCPSATSIAVMTPIVFCASLAPWLNASAEAVAHSDRRTGPVTLRRARRTRRRATRAPIQPAAKPTNGETARVASTPVTPVGRTPSNPPQRTACQPSSAMHAPQSPPTSAWLELDGRPRHQVRRFQATAAVRPAPTTATTSAGETEMMLSIVLATAVPITSGPAM
jgi:hypothetical protein